MHTENIFENRIDQIKAYIESAFPGYIAALVTADSLQLSPPARYEIDYPDVDRYSEGVVLYLLPDVFALDDFTLDSEQLRANINLYITVRKDSPENLYKKILRLGAAFYNMVKDNPGLGGAVDEANVSSVQYYRQVEGSANTKALEITLQISKEV